MNHSFFGIRANALKIVSLEASFHKIIFKKIYSELINLFAMKKEIKISKESPV